MNGLIGRKLGMTRIFNAEGTHVPVTVIEAGPCPVVAVFDGRVELGFGAKKPKNAPKALAGHVKKAGVETTPRIIRRFDVTGDAPAAGTAGTPAIFPQGARVEGGGGAEGPGVQGGVHPPPFPRRPGPHPHTPPP